MPLTDVQAALLAVVADRAEEAEGYLAGGAAINFAPNSTRYSRDLDFFHDSVERVAKAFEADRPPGSTGRNHHPRDARGG